MSGGLWRRAALLIAVVGLYGSIGLFSAHPAWQPGIFGHHLWDIPLSVWFGGVVIAGTFALMWIAALEDDREDDRGGRT